MTSFCVMTGRGSAPNMLSQTWGLRSADAAAMAFSIVGTWTSSVVLSAVRWLSLPNSSKARVPCRAPYHFHLYQYMAGHLVEQLCETKDIKCDRWFGDCSGACVWNQSLWFNIKVTMYKIGM